MNCYNCKKELKSRTFKLCLTCYSNYKVVVGSKWLKSYGLTQKDVDNANLFIVGNKEDYFLYLRSEIVKLSKDLLDKKRKYIIEVLTTLLIKYDIEFNYKIEIYLDKLLQNNSHDITNFSYLMEIADKINYNKKNNLF